MAQLLGILLTNSRVASDHTCSVTYAYALATRELPSNSWHRGYAFGRHSKCLLIYKEICEVGLQGRLQQLEKKNLKDFLSH